MEAVDSYIPEPKRERQAIPDACRGRILNHRKRNSSNRKSRKRNAEGKRRSRDRRTDRREEKVVVTGVEMFRKLLDEAETGDNIGALLRGVQRDEIERGQVLAAPGTSIRIRSSRAGIRTEERRGRKTYTVLQRIQTTVLFQNNRRNRRHAASRRRTEMCMPGDNVVMEIDLITPIAIEEGLRFAIREGGRTVGSGVVRVQIKKLRNFK
jgi:elongation factor Tu